MIGELGTKSLRNLFGGNIPTAQVLQGIASGMASCGVNVVIDPSCKVPYAIITQKKIVLPTQVRSERALLVVNWFVDHEAGHIIFTPGDMTRYLSAWQRNSEMLKVLKKHGYQKFPDSLLGAARSMLNLAEDARIEKLMIERIPGTKKNFLGGPIACDLADVPNDIVDKAKEVQAELGLSEYPVNPFWAAQMHVYHLLDGTHQRHPRNHVRSVLKGHSVEGVLDIVDEEFGDITNVMKETILTLASRTDRAMARIFDLILDQAEEEDEDGEGEGEGEGEGGDDSADNPFQTKFKKGKSKGKGKGGQKQELDEEPSEGGGSGEEDDDKDQDKEEDDSDGSGSGGQSDEDSEEQDNDDSGESNDGSGESDESDEEDEEGEGGSSEEDSDEDSESEGDESEEDSDSGEDSDGESDSEPEESEEPKESNGTENDAEVNHEQKIPKQIEEWAEGAQADMADLMRGAEQEQQGEDGERMSAAERSTGSGNPTCAPDASTAGMPENYFSKIAPGVKTIYLTGSDLSRLVNEHNMKAYVDTIRGLTPPNLGPAARRLVGQFKEARGEAWTGKRINPRRLVQIKAGTAYDKKLFLRNNQSTLSRKGVAVMVLVDGSGSMASNVAGANFKDRNANSKMALSHASTLGIARLFQAVNVPFAVGGFTTASARVYGDHARNCHLVHMLYKDFHEPWNSSEVNLLSFNTFSQYALPDGTFVFPNCNSDGEAVIWGATHLMTRDEDTKVLIVISDGLPAGGARVPQSAFLKWAVRRCMLAGIRVGGFGLGCEDVKFYYPIHEILGHFPTGQGGEDIAPLILQEKLISLIDKVMTYNVEEVVR